MLHTVLCTHQELEWDLDLKTIPFWRRLRFVYPGISRRAGGVSVGINLTPDRNCNFNCVYCEVDRSAARGPAAVDLDVLELELRRVVDSCLSGELFADRPFAGAQERFRRLRYITFSGDGEPTMSPRFAEAVKVALRVRDAIAGGDVEVVLITDSAGLRDRAVRTGLQALSTRPHQVWAKLDAGTELQYQRVNRARVPYETILANITETAKEHPLYLQSLFLKMRGEGPAEAEIDAYCGRVETMLATGSQILGLQINTIARRPTEAWAEPLVDEELDAVAARIRRRVGLPQQITYRGDFHVSRQAALIK